MSARHLLAAAFAALIGAGAAHAETIKIGVTPGPHGKSVV